MWDGKVRAVEMLCANGHHMGIQKNRDGMGRGFCVKTGGGTLLGIVGFQRGNTVWDHGQTIIYIHEYI